MSFKTAKMQKIWGYILAIALGIIGGMILMYQIVKKNINNTLINVRKIKQKGTIDSVQDITNAITTETKRIDKKAERKAKREERKLKRQKKKALRKQK